MSRSTSDILFGKHLHGEPWVDIETNEEFNEWDEETLIAFNQVLRQSQKVFFFKNAFELLYANNISGDYLEFGCHRARTFRMSLTEARRKNFERMRFFAFDSFEGLPVSDGSHEVPTYQPGNLSTPEDEFLRLVKEHGIFVDKIKTIKGFYQDSLNTDLKNKLSNENVKVAMATVDCDLYESAVPVFNFLETFIQEGSYIYIDDYFCGYRGSPKKGVAKAFHDFEKTSKYGFHPHVTVGWWGKAFIVYDK